MIKTGRVVVVATLLGLWLRTGDAPERLRSRLAARRDERGSVTMEQVIITGALVGLALGLVAVIGIAVAKYSSEIK